MRRILATLATLTAALALAGAAHAAYLAGYNPGTGLTHAHGSVDLTAWQDAQTQTGTIAQTVKLFDTASGYPNFPTAWGGQAKMCATNNAGVPLKPLYAFNNIPTAAAIETFLRSLPAGQTAGFIYQSEAEHSGMTGATFRQNFATVRARLNTALIATGHTRAQFPLGTSAYMAYYATRSSTAYIPKGADFLGADFYQHIGGSQSVGAGSDPRFQHWLAAVHAVYGTAAPIAFTEYGISIPAYTAANEQARANLLAKDLAYVNGLSEPFLFWMYWYQHDATPDFYEFPLIAGYGETTADAQPTVSVWQRVVAG